MEKPSQSVLGRMTSLLPKRVWLMLLPALLTTGAAQAQTQPNIASTDLSALFMLSENLTLPKWLAAFIQTFLKI